MGQVSSAPWVTVSNRKCFICMLSNSLLIPLSNQQQNGGTLPPGTNQQQTSSPPQQQQNDNLRPRFNNMAQASATSTPPQKVSQIQALTTVAANTNNNPAVVHQAAETIYPAGRQVTEVQRTQTGFDVYSAPKEVAPPVVNTQDGYSLLGEPLGSPNMGRAPNIVEQQFNKPAPSSAGFRFTQDTGMGMGAGQAQEFKKNLPGYIGASTIKTGSVLLAGVTAPSMGLTGVTKAGLLGVGITQGVKTGTTLYEGGDVSKSLLTPKEAFEAGVGGVAFSGAGGAILGKAGLIGKSGLVAAGERVGINTAMGAGVGFVQSGGKPEGAIQGAEFGAVFGVAGETLGAFAKTSAGKKVSEFATNVKEKAFGVKATELVGASEIVKQSQVGPNEYEVTKLTEPLTRNTRISREEADFFRMVSNRKVSLAGTENVAQYGGGEYDLYSKSIETGFRTADPLIAAAKGEPYAMSKAKVGSLDLFDIESPSATLAVGKQNVLVNKGEVYSETTIKTSEPIIAPKLKMSERSYTGAQMTGEIDPQVYADYGKNMPADFANKIYKELGGGYKPMIEPVSPKSSVRTVSTFKDGLFDVQKVEGASSKGMKPMGGDVGSPAKPSDPLLIEPTTKNVQVQLEKNIIDVAPAKTSTTQVMFSGVPTQRQQRQSQQYMYDEEPIYTQQSIGKVTMNLQAPQRLSPTTATIRAQDSFANITPARFPFNIERADPLADVSLFSVQTPALLPELAPIQSTRTTQTQKATQISRTSTDLFNPSFTPLSSTFQTPGFKFEGAGYNIFGPQRRTGLLSRKKVYPILSGPEVLKL
jgi:hypothetical protein